MKTLRFLFSGILSILISYSLCSCGGGDDDDVTPPNSGQSGDSGNNGSGQSGTNTSKKLVKIDIDYPGESETINFQYDKQGNLSFVSEEEGDEISEFTFTYDEDRILMTGIEDKELDGSDPGESKKMTYYLSNGKVTSIRDEEINLDPESEESYDYSYYDFEYDNVQKRLVRVTANSNSSYGSYYYTNSYEEEFSWFGDKLVTLSYDSDSWSYPVDFYYDEPISCKGFFPLTCISSEALHECYLLMVKPELASIKTNTLPNSSSDGGTYTYELDNEGYLRKMCERRNGGQPVYYIFTWK
jgi:hypothetical protein